MSSSTPSPRDSVLAEADGDGHRRPDETTATVKRPRTKKLVLVGPEGQVVCDACYFANHIHTRVRGLIGYRRLREGEGMLLHPSFSVHTAFVRFPIDAVFLDQEMRVLRIAHLKPWRIAVKWGAREVLELGAGECERLGLRLGDRLAWGIV